MRALMRSIWTIVGAVLLVALIVYGLWQVGWWFNEQNVQRQREVNHHSQQYQDGLVSQERDRVQAYNAAVDAGQKRQIASTFCTVYLDINEPPTDIRMAHSTICTGN